MRVVFFGSPSFAVASLEAVQRSSHQVAAVVTQPARARGRGRKSAPSPVRVAAEAHAIPVLEPDELDAGFVRELRGYAPEVLVVVAYGKLLPPRVLGAAPRGAVNVHPSLLPRHRGAAPIQHAVLRGDRVTGVTTMQLDETFDTGGTLLVRETAIGADEDAEELDGRLAAIGAELLVETLDRLQAGTLRPTPQPDEGATHARKLTAEDAWIDWTQPADVLARQVRGLKPWPQAQTTLPDGRRLKLVTARARAAASAEGEPGTVLRAGRDGIEVASGGGTSLVVTAAQPEGKRPLTAADLVNGRVLPVGARLGQAA